MMLRASDIKRVGYKPAVAKLVKIFNRMGTDGIVLFRGSKKETTIYVVMSKILGDNLGLHAVCGFRKSFTMQHPCMYCEITYEDLKKTTVLDPLLTRTIEKYEKYFEEEDKPWEFGVEFYSEFNKLKSFHVAQNMVHDIMHDLQLGKIKFFLSNAISYFIKTYRGFNLNLLNERIQGFDYGYKESSNKPGIILDSHIAKSLHMNANESLCLLRLLPLIIYGLVPYPDAVYQLLLKTADLIEKCFMWEFTEESIAELECLIRSNNMECMREFGSDLKPKEHHMLHYGMSVKENGPLRGCTTIRLEAKHQTIRSYTNNNKSRKSIHYGVSIKSSFEFALSIFKAKSKSSLLHITDYKTNRTQEMSEDIKDFLLDFQFDIGKFRRCEYYI